MGRTKAAVATGAICLAGLTLYLSVPRSIASALEFSTTPVISTLRQGRMTSLAAQDRLIVAKTRAAKWIDSGEQRLDSAFAIMVRRFSRAKKLDGKLSDKQSFQPVERRVEAGLALSPVNASGWRWLALARMTHKDAAGAAMALRMSLYTGPHQPLLAVSRLRLLMNTWDQFSKDERETIYRQIRFAWKHSQDGVTALALESQSLWPYRLALAARPRDLRNFEHELKRAKAEAVRKSKGRK